MGRLDEKVVLITGAASGIGRVAAELFAAEGARVAIADVVDADGQAASTAIRATGGEAAFVHADVSDATHVEAMVRFALDTFGRLPVQGLLRRRRGKGLCRVTPHSAVIEDYHILQTTKDEYLIRQIRNSMDAAGVPVEFSKGEAGRGQHEINLRYADALEMADRHTVYKNGAKEIAALNDRAITFMAKYTMDECGNSCHLHSSLWSAEADEPLDWDDGAADHMSETFRYYVGGLVAASRELS
jgi:glutamine synthetase